MSAVGKPCFMCSHEITQEDINKHYDWSVTTKSDTGILVDAEINYPDEEAVVCFSCHEKSELRVMLRVLRK